MNKRRTYLALLVLFAISTLCAFVFPAPGYFEGLFSVPAVAALLGLLVQIARDSAQFERQRFLQLDEQIFTLGASSHMSSVAFDKHVEFCEAYMSEVHDTVGLLFAEGPTHKATECAHRLFALKRRFAAWMPHSVALKLDPFESALSQMGAQEHLARALRDGGDREVRSRAIDESYDLFRKMLNLDRLKDADPNDKKEIAVENVKEEVRCILGINELIEIREFIIQRSADFARSNSKQGR